MSISRDSELRAALKSMASETLEDIGRLPAQIEGGFIGLAGDFERRGRVLTVMLRQLEQDRLQLESAEGERSRLSAKLDAVIPKIQESYQNVVDAVEISKSGDLSGELSSHFSANMSALDELEQVSVALSNNFLTYRSNWERYARSVLCAQQMRDEA